MQLNKAKLAAMMKYQNVNQKELCGRTGLSVTTVSAICRGCTCSDKTAKKIAAALGLTVNDLK